MDVLTELNALAKKNAAPNAMSDAVKGALRDTAAGRARLAAAIDKMLKDSGELRKKMEKSVTGLSRQSDSKQVPKTIMKDLRAAQKTIEGYVEEAGQLTGKFDKESKQVKDPDLAGQMKKLSVPDESVKAASREKDAIVQQLKLAEAAIAQLDDDNQAVEELIGQTRGIMTNAEDKARVAAEATEVVRHITNSCDSISDGLKDARKKISEIDKLAARASDKRAVDQAVGHLRGLERALQQAKQAMAKVDTTNDVFVKTIKINYPKIVSVLDDTRQPIRDATNDIRKFETELKQTSKKVDQLAKAKAKL